MPGARAGCLGEDRYLPIGDYALLSDGHSTALLSCNGSIDWTCFGSFDNASVFARLLDAYRGGHFVIRPRLDNARVERHYLPEAMVLETTWKGDQGRVRCTDCFAMRSGGGLNTNSRLLRWVEVLEGDVDIDIEFIPRFGYDGIRRGCGSTPGAPTAQSAVPMAWYCTAVGICRSTQSSFARRHVLQ